jgi:hypothetical protein
LCEVGLVMPVEFEVNDSPLTENGSLNVIWKDVGERKVLIGPPSSAGQPTFRVLQIGDLGIVFLEYQFTVGVGSAPLAGESEFTLKDCEGNDLTGVKIDVIRERDPLIPLRDYTHTDVDSLVELTVPMSFEETFVIKAYPAELWNVCSLEIVQSGFPYSLPFTLP